MKVVKLVNFFLQMNLDFQHHAYLWADTRILKKCATTIFKVGKIISNDGGGGRRQVNYRGGFLGVAKPWDGKGQVDVGPGQQKQ
jgi:hypothetical protein